MKMNGDANLLHAYPGKQKNPIFKNQIQSRKFFKNSSFFLLMEWNFISVRKMTISNQT